MADDPGDAASRTRRLAMQSDVKIRERDRDIVLTKRVEVRVSEIGPVIASSFAEVYAYLAKHGVRPTEPPFVIYLGIPGLTDVPFGIEICAPIGQAIDPPEGWTLLELAAGTFASIVHVGPYDSIGAAYDEIEAWIGEHELVIAGPPREVYLSDAETPRAEIRTVVEFPVEPSKAELPQPVG
jgi:AraC family transcriptional regulator